MRRGFNYGGMGGGASSSMHDRQSTFMSLMQKQNRVIQKLADRVGGGYNDVYHEDGYYGPGQENFYPPGPGPMRGGPRGYGGPGGWDGPRPRGGHWEALGPRQVMPTLKGRSHGGGGQGKTSNEPKFVKQCKTPVNLQIGYFNKATNGIGYFPYKQREIYLETIKKNIPTNGDLLSVFCVTCSHTAKNNQDFFLHRNSSSHLRQMDRIAEMPENIRKEVKAVTIEIHVMRNEQKSLLHCSICAEHIPVPYSDHKNMIKHVSGKRIIYRNQNKSRAVRTGCIPCQTGEMKCYPDYVAHLATEEHTKRFEEHQRDLEMKIENCEESKDYPLRTEGVMYGLKHVQPIDGFHCSLCHKFLFSEEEAEEHSKLQRHFNHVMDEFFNPKRKEAIDIGDYSLPADIQKAEDDKYNINGSSITGDKVTVEEVAIEEEEAMETSEN